MNAAMTGSNAQSDPDVEPDRMRDALGVDAPLIDPRWGDIGDDVASPGQRSLLAIAGSLLVEISLPKLLLAVPSTS